MAKRKKKPVDDGSWVKAYNKARSKAEEGYPYLSKSTEGYVYLIECDSPPLEVGDMPPWNLVGEAAQSWRNKNRKKVEGVRVKIGFTTDPTIEARLKDLQTGNPFPLKILGAVRGKAELERVLHQKYRNRRLMGEWFKLSRSEVDRLISSFANPSMLHAMLSPIRAKNLEAKTFFKKKREMETAKKAESIKLRRDTYAPREARLKAKDLKPSDGRPAFSAVKVSSL